MSYPRIFCLGRNYAEHVKELYNEMPNEPVIFMKPYSALNDNKPEIYYPKHGDQLQHEVEFVVRIGDDLKPEAISVGLDLTLRDVQTRMKDNRFPWEKAKSFDDSARTAEWVAMDDLDLTQLDLSCSVNGEVKQQGRSEQMMRSIEQVVAEVAALWQLLPGDLIYTGTPKGVGDLQVGDEITITSAALSVQQSFMIV